MVKKIVLAIMLTCSITQAKNGNRLALLVPVNFNETELFAIREVLHKNRVQTDIYGIRSGRLYGDNGGFVEPKKSMEQIKPQEYSGIVLIGGSGAAGAFWGKQRVLKLLKKFDNEGLIVGGSGAASIAVAQSGLLNGKRVTTYADERYKGYVKELKKLPVTYVDRETVINRNIITSNGLTGVFKFASYLATMVLSE